MDGVSGATGMVVQVALVEPSAINVIYVIGPQHQPPRLRTKKLVRPHPIDYLQFFSIDSWGDLQTLSAFALTNC
jgi:hypothetical protein